MAFAFLSVLFLIIAIGIGQITRGYKSTELNDAQASTGVNSCPSGLGSAKGKWEDGKYEIHVYGHFLSIESQQSISGKDDYGYAENSLVQVEPMSKIMDKSNESGKIPDGPKVLLALSSVALIFMLIGTACASMAGELGKPSLAIVALVMGWLSFILVFCGVIICGISKIKEIYCPSNHGFDECGWGPGMGLSAFNVVLLFFFALFATIFKAAVAGPAGSAPSVMTSSAV